MSVFKPTVLGAITENHDFEPDSKEIVKFTLGQFKVGDVVSVTYKKHKDGRSLRQNAYYWGCVIQACHKYFHDLGEIHLEPYDVHIYLSEKFLPCCDINLSNGDVLKKRTSTTELNTNEFNDYFLLIIQWVAEISDNTIKIPLPNE